MVFFCFFIFFLLFTVISLFTLFFVCTNYNRLLATSPQVITFITIFFFVVRFLRWSCALQSVSFENEMKSKKCETQMVVSHRNIIYLFAWHVVISYIASESFHFHFISLILLNITILFTCCSSCYGFLFALEHFRVCV